MNGNSSSQTIQKQELCLVLRGCSGKRPKAFSKLNKWQKHFPLLCVMGVRVRSVLKHSLSLPSCCCYSHTWGRMDLDIHEEDETWQCTNLHAFGSALSSGFGWTVSSASTELDAEWCGKTTEGGKCQMFSCFVRQPDMSRAVCNHGIYTQRANGAILAVSHPTPCQVSSSLIMT